MRWLAAVVGALVVAAPSYASENRPRLSEFEESVMCPVCEGETLGMSSSPAARQVERFIQRRIDAGDTRSEIRNRLVQEYGPAILAAPPRRGWGWLAWLLPVVAIVLGAVAIAVGAWRWSRAREPGEPPFNASANGNRRLDPELERRLDEELARFE